MKRHPEHSSPIHSPENFTGNHHVVMMQTSECYHIQQFERRRNTGNDSSHHIPCDDERVSSSTNAIQSIYNNSNHSSNSSSISHVTLVTIIFLILSLCANLVSSRPEASIDPQDRLRDYESIDPNSLTKKDGGVCERNSEKWDRCERCARTTRSRNTFRICCSDDAGEKYCKELMEYEPPNFTSRRRRAPSNFNRLVRSLLTHSFPHPDLW